MKLNIRWEWRESSVKGYFDCYPKTENQLNSPLLRDFGIHEYSETSDFRVRYQDRPRGDATIWINRIDLASFADMTAAQQHMEQLLIKFIKEIVK